MTCPLRIVTNSTPCSRARQSASAFTLSLALLFALPGVLRGNMGAGNPTGPAGAFNGSVTTGGSYDPMTGNATRSVNDLVVVGGVGAYPLAFTRSANSRYQSTSQFQFGASGGWRHSYTWAMDESDESTDSNFQPAGYSISFPDGRVVYFDGEGDGPAGVRERVQARSGNFVYLKLPDGGRIEFRATRRIRSEWDEGLGFWITYFRYTYQALGIIDPYSQRTTLAYNGDGILSGDGSLSSVTEPGQRWLYLSYTTVGGLNPARVVDYVQASDGRRVQYHYGDSSYVPYTAHTTLDSAVYPFEPALGFSPTASRVQIAGSR